MNFTWTVQSLMGILENVSSSSSEETYKDRVTKKRGGGLRGRNRGFRVVNKGFRVVKRGFRVVTKAGQGSWEERKLRENEGPKRGGGSGSREGFFIHVF